MMETAQMEHQLASALKVKKVGLGVAPRGESGYGEPHG